MLDQHKSNDIRLTNFDRKPLACSSPIITKKGGKEYRHHLGYYSGNGYAVKPTDYPVNKQDRILLGENDE